MFDFKEEYVERQEVKNESVSLLEMIEPKIRKITSKAELVEMSSRSKDTSGIAGFLKDIMKDCVALNNTVRGYAVNIGFGRVVENAVSELVHCNICDIDGDYHIYFDKLLPYRSQYYNDNKDSVYPSYIKALHTEAKRAALPVRSARTAVVFLHHFADEKNMLDYDNMETKSIMDAVAVNYLKDDSPKWCTYYMDCVVDGENYSEIILMEQSRLAEFIKGR